jgi:hypothetical protein
VSLSRETTTNLRLHIIAIALLGCTSLAQPSSPGLTPLKTSLPKPVFVGTPRVIVAPNLERVTGKLRTAPRVPGGTRNLAAGRPVTGSDPKPFVGRYAMVTDGNKEATGNSFLELAPGPQWIQIDLGKRAVIHGVLLWHYHSEARVYHDVIVHLGNSPDGMETRQPVFNNDHDNSSKLGMGTDKEYIETFEGRFIPVRGHQGRFIRLSSNGNTTDDMNDYVEVEVFGVPVP